MTRFLFLCTMLGVVTVMSEAAATESSEVADTRRVLVFSIRRESSTQRLAAAIIEEAYGRVGMETDIRYLPNKRSLIMSSSGQIDGEVGRITSIAEPYANLIQVGKPYIDIHWQLYFSNLELSQRVSGGLDQLRVGILKGVGYSDQKTIHQQRVSTSSVTQLFELLRLNRIDAVLISGFSGDIEIAKNFPNNLFYKRKTPLESLGVTHFLHVRHRELVPKIAKSLRQMKESGRIQELREETAAKLIAGEDYVSE